MLKSQDEETGNSNDVNNNLDLVKNLARLTVSENSATGQASSAVSDNGQLSSESPNQDNDLIIFSSDDPVFQNRADSKIAETKKT